MRVLVCGSRSWPDIHTIRMRLVTLPPSATIMHGAAAGADTVAAWLAEDFGFTVEAYPPDYAKHGKAAPHVRNDAMLEHAQLVLAFWDGRSRGTKSVIDKAHKRGIPVEVIPPPDTDTP
jgi:hypothetical protein